MLSKLYEDPSVFNPLGVYREMGIKIAKLEQFEKSLQYFDEALKVVNDNRALLGRAICRAQTCEYNNALKDLATLEKNLPENIYVSAVQCLVKYLCCEFEKAMVEYVCKSNYRKKPPNFVLGVMHCEEAIQNNLGVRAGHPLRDHFNIIRKLAWQRVFEAWRPFQPVIRTKKKRKLITESAVQLAAPIPRIPLPSGKYEKKRDKEKTSSILWASGSKGKLDMELASLLSSENTLMRESLASDSNSLHRYPSLQTFPFKPIQKYTTNIRNLMAERYLDKMCYDKLFLQSLKSNVGVKSPNIVGAKKITNLAKKSSKYISYNQELLRSRRPFYLLRYQDGKIGHKLRERQLEKERMMTKFNESEAQSFIEKIQIANDRRNLLQVIELGERMFRFCESTPKITLPNRNKYLQRLYILMRDGFYETKSIGKNMTDDQISARIAYNLGLPRKFHGTADSYAMQFMHHFTDKRKQCKIFEERVRKSKSRNEVVWLYHELSRFNLDLREYDLSKGYATKCFKESHILDDQKWTINAIFMAVKVSVALKNKNGAKTDLKKCLKVAQILGDQMMKKFIQMCIDQLEETRMEAIQPIKLLENRTNHIVRLLPTDDLKSKAKVIFQRIASLPTNKRLSVLPGVEYSVVEMHKRTNKKKKTTLELCANESDDLRPKISSSHH